MTKWLVPATFFILALLFLITLVGATEIGEYRTSFENAKIALDKINESLTYLEGVNESAVEELRGKVSRIKSELNITDREVAEERLEIENKAAEALKSRVSKVESENKNAFLTVFGTFGVLTGFWGAFFACTILSSRRKR